jgi:hypothetical protein
VPYARKWLKLCRRDDRLRIVSPLGWRRGSEDVELASPYKRSAHHTRCRGTSRGGGTHPRHRRPWTTAGQTSISASRSCATAEPAASSPASDASVSAAARGLGNVGETEKMSTRKVTKKINPCLKFRGFVRRRFGSKGIFERCL